MLALSLVTFISGLYSIVKRCFDVQVVKLLVLVCEYGFDLGECPRTFTVHSVLQLDIVVVNLRNCKKHFLTFGNLLYKRGGSFHEPGPDDPR